MYIPQSNPAIRKNLFQQIQPDNSGVITPLIPLNVRDLYSSSAVLAFRFYHQNSTRVRFVLTEAIPPNEIEVARLSLPLSWFPHGYVVHNFFPFETKTPGLGCPFIELDVHITKPEVIPFAAYFSVLKVVPSWTPPPEIVTGSLAIIVPNQPPPTQTMPTRPQPTQKVRTEPKPVKTEKAKPIKLGKKKEKDLTQENQETDSEDSFESGIHLESIDGVGFLNSQNVSTFQDETNSNLDIFPNENEKVQPIAESHEPNQNQQINTGIPSVQQNQPPQQQFTQPCRTATAQTPQFNYPSFPPLPEQISQPQMQYQQMPTQQNQNQQMQQPQMQYQQVPTQQITSNEVESQNETNSVNHKPDDNQGQISS